MPADVLHRICLAMEDGLGDALDRKHRNNLDVIAMMDVSRSWRDDIVKFDDLFTHIAFDTSDGRTVATAARILRLAETGSAKLEVFIRSSPWDLTSNTKLHIMAGGLIRRLGLQSGRFIHFELQSRSSHLTPYFNLPAPNLRSLLHGCVVLPALFSSSFPNLRVLHMHVNKFSKIPPSALFNLVELQLVNSRRTQRFSVESVLALLRNTGRLEVLQLSGFAWFGCVSAAPEPVELANLKSVKFVDCHLPELLPQLHFKQLCEFNFCGFNLTPDENTPPSMVSNTNFFPSLQGCPLPILDQEPLTHIFISTYNKGDKIEFTLRLMSGPGLKYKFVITMVWGNWMDWEEHLKQTIGGAMKRIRLASSMYLYLFHYVGHTWGLYSPLLRLPQINVLCTAGLFTPVAFKLLTNPNHPTYSSPLPRLKCFCFREGELHVSTEDIQFLVKLCLWSRFNKRQPLAVRCFLPDGDDPHLGVLDLLLTQF